MEECMDRMLRFDNMNMVLSGCNTVKSIALRMVESMEAMNIVITRSIIEHACGYNMDMVRKINGEMIRYLSEKLDIREIKPCVFKISNSDVRDNYNIKYTVIYDANKSIAIGNHIVISKVEGSFNDYMIIDVLNGDVMAARAVRIPRSYVASIQAGSPIDVSSIGIDTVYIRHEYNFDINSFVQECIQRGIMPVNEYLVFLVVIPSGKTIFGCDAESYEREFVKSLFTGNKIAFIGRRMQELDLGWC